MITVDTDKGVHQVIPRWMTYIQSVGADEFGRFGDTASSLAIPQRFAFEFEQFLRNPAPRIGSDLFERALVMGLDTQTVQLAQYVAQQNTLSAAVRSVAERVASKGKPQDETTYDLAISHHRRFLRMNPRNAIRWAELARLYVIKRNKDKALRAIRTALQLSPTDRYVVRSALRCFIHFEDNDQLLSVCGDDVTEFADPWIKGVGISALLIAGKAPKRKIIPHHRDFDQRHLFNYSEYLAACGMLEIHYGKRNQAKQLFTGAWKDPSGNVTTHAEWVTRAHFPGLRPELSQFKHPTPEAKARVAFSQGYWEQMYEAVSDWKLQEPFSRGPLRFLANAENTQGNFDAALSFIKMAEARGTLDFGLSISKIYALLCSGKLPDALEILSAIDVPEKASLARCVLVANWGLYSLLAGDTAAGFDLYARAEREASLMGQLSFRDRVFANRIVAQRMAGLDVDDQSLTRLKQIVSENAGTIEIQMLGKRALSSGKIAVNEFKKPCQIPLPALHDCAGPL